MAFLNAAQGLTPDSAAPLVLHRRVRLCTENPLKQSSSDISWENLADLSKSSQGKGQTEGRMFTPSNFEDYRPEDPVPYEVVVDEKMDLEIGEQITLGNEKVRVVGKAKSLMFVLDTPLLFMDVRIAQKLLLGNTPHVNMMIAKADTNEQPGQVSAGLDALETIEARTLKQTLRDIIAYYVDEPMKAVQFLRVMLWLAAGILVGMITYVTMLEKTQEIGVLKAIGASDYYVMGLLLKQVVLISAVGVVLGLILSYVFAAAAPIFVAIHFIESIIVVCISFVVCCGSGYLAARKAIAVDPMIAFRGEI